MADFVRQYLPILIVGAIIGAFAIVFVLAYLALQKHKEKEEDNERHMADSEIIRRLLGYAKPYWKSFVAVFFIMIFSIVYDLLSPLIIGDIQGLIKDDFQLRGCEGLYFIGETCDCAGFCGGYNLHWAFGSAILAGKSAAALRKSAPKKPAKAAPKKKKR